MAELKPCPFCGGKARIKHYSGGNCIDELVTVECDNCGAGGKVFKEISFDPEDDKQKAIEAWNRRADNGST